MLAVLSRSRPERSIEAHRIQPSLRTGLSPKPFAGIVLNRPPPTGGDDRPEATALKGEGSRRRLGR
jgi:hypothetical protein